MTAIRNAFANSLRFTGKRCTAVESLIVTALGRSPRLSRDQQRGWSTKISFRTYNSLKNQGILD